MRLGMVGSSCLLAVALPALVRAAPDASTRPKALTHAVVIDGSGGAPVEDGVVIVRGERIEEVGPAGSVQVPPDAEVTDLRGKAVLPGLADMHVHFAHGWDGTSFDLLGFQRYLNAFLYAGVTTILDAGNSPGYILQVRDEVAAGRLLGPRLYCVGPLIDGPDPLWPAISYSVSSAEQVPGVVRRLKEDRVDALKVYAGLSDRLVGAVVQEARKSALPVLVDQTWRNGSIELVMGDGVTTFAHLPDFPLGAFSTQQAAQMMKRRGVRFVSTVAVVEYQARRRLADPGFLEEPLVRHTTPPAILEAVRAEARRELDERGQASVRHNQERLKNRLANAKEIFDRGLLLAAGTDAPYPGVFQGEGIHRELELLVEAGLRPLDAISCATLNAARLMGAEGEWGTLAAGRVANVVVVDGRPDQRIQDTRNVRMVMLRGQVLDREELRLR
jgi:imidazolonepropionase-like amidohydrolase